MKRALLIVLCVFYFVALSKQADKPNKQTGNVKKQITDVEDLLLINKLFTNDREYLWRKKLSESAGIKNQKEMIRETLKNTKQKKSELLTTLWAKLGEIKTATEKLEAINGQIINFAKQLSDKLSDRENIFDKGSKYTPELQSIQRSIGKIRKEIKKKEKMKQISSEKIEAMMEEYRHVREEYNEIEKSCMKLEGQLQLAHNKLKSKVSEHNDIRKKLKESYSKEDEIDAKLSEIRKKLESSKK